jgi:hypothetical protein
MGTQLRAYLFETCQIVIHHQYLFCHTPKLFQFLANLSCIAEICKVSHCPDCEGFERSPGFHDGDTSKTRKKPRQL